MNRFKAPAALLAVAVLAMACSEGSVPTGVTPSDVIPQFAHGTGGWDDVILHAGNPSCTDLGYAFGVKKEPIAQGQTIYPDGFTINVSGVYLTSWSAPVPVSAVLVKGGPNANEYQYDPPTTSDSGDPGLHSPDHPNPGSIPGISHIEFCVNPALVVTKDAETTYDRTWTWDIEKDLDMDLPLEFGEGDQLSVDYTVLVSATFEDSNWAVSGKITIENPAAFGLAATIQNVSDVITPGDIAANVDCGVTFPHVLASGATLECDYDADLPNADTRLNTATVTTSGDVAGGQATADVEFGDPTNEIDTCIDVKDVLEINGVEVADEPLGTVCAPDDLDANGEYEFEYTRTFGAGGDFELECDDNTVDNVASFITNDTETTGQDDAGFEIFVICEVGGFAGCTPGYWSSPKGSQNWAVYSTGQTVANVFGAAAGTNVGDVTLLDALSLGGGSGADGARRILARAAVAAVLNAAHSDVDYPMTAAEVIAAVNAVIGGNDRPAMLALATELDELNNLGCTIDAHGAPIED